MDLPFNSPDLREIERRGSELLRQFEEFDSQEWVVVAVPHEIPLILPEDLFPLRDRFICRVGVVHGQVRISIIREDEVLAIGDFNESETGVAIPFTDADSIVVEPIDANCISTVSVQMQKIIPHYEY